MSEAKGNNKVLIYGLVIIIAVFWGFSFLATSILVDYLEPIQVQAARWIVAAAFYGAMIAMGKIRIDLSKKSRWLLLACGLSQPCFLYDFRNLRNQDDIGIGRINLRCNNSVWSSSYKHTHLQAKDRT